MKSRFEHIPVNEAFTLTKIYWENEKPVSVDQMNWLFSNMEKIYNLWHPGCHIDFAWIKPQNEHPINAVHWASELYGPPGQEFPMSVAIRQLPLEYVPPFVTQYIEHDQALVFAAHPCEKIEDYVEKADDDCQYPLYVVHSYSAKGDTTEGIDYCVWFNETQFGHGWAPHATEEASSVENFLPQLYELYDVIDNRYVNRKFDFKVSGKGAEARYVNL